MTIKIIVPVKTAEFRAARWDGTDEARQNIDWLASEYGWQWRSLANGGLMIHGRNRKRYAVEQGRWVIALGTNGSIRICTDRKYREDYREVSE